MRVTVLKGGWGSEREVSLVTGRGVEAALARLGHEVIALDMGASRGDGATLAGRLLATRPDCVFNALHGTPGEDGTVQGLMDILGLRYTHSGLAASAVAMDKQLTRRLLAPEGVRMPEGVRVTSRSLFERDPLPRPYVVKPVAEGSSVGVAIIGVDGRYGTPIAAGTPGPWDSFPELLAEPFIPGLELTVAVLETSDGTPEALGVTELRPVDGFYDYEAKYTDGRTVHICPADIPADLAAQAMADAVAAHRLLGCRGVSRSDFRHDPSRGADGLHLLELNTQPGLTPLSLVPEQADARGIGYDRLVARILERAAA